MIDAAGRLGRLSAATLTCRPSRAGCHYTQHGGGSGPAKNWPAGPPGARDGPGPKAGDDKVPYLNTDHGTNTGLRATLIINKFIIGLQA